MSEPLAELDALIAALKEPLTSDDAADGWTEAARVSWLAYVSGLREGIRVTTDYEHSMAPRHLIRWLDHDGIGVKGGRLAQLAAEAQLSLRNYT